MKKKLLIVEDEREMRRELSLFFQRKGFEVREAENGRDGIKVFGEYDPDVVVLDIRMANGSGKEFLADLRKLGQRQAVVLCISGYADLSMGDAYANGADVYFAKPFNPEDLLKAASAFLDSKEQLSQERDQTKEIRERLSATSEIFEIGLMSAHVGHEINNRLAVICSSIDLIKVRTEAGGEAAQTPEMKVVLSYLDRVKNQADGIQKIVHGLQTLTYRGTPEGFVPALLKTIIDDVVSLCDNRFRSKRVTFECLVPPEEIKVRCHPHQISQVLVNLLNNAFDAVQMPGGKKWIKLAASKVEGFLEIRVSDGGTGVPAKIKDKLFEPFFTTKSLGNGTGLGLSLARKIMELHGGGLTMDTQVPETCFVVRMPILASGAS